MDAQSPTGSKICKKKEKNKEKVVSVSILVQVDLF